MKYIDADKLIAEIRELRSESCISESDEYYEYAKSEIINIIHSLQQEQPAWDLEKELDRIWFDNKLGNYFDNDALDFAHIRTLCKHFYELGLNARKEE